MIEITALLVISLLYVIPLNLFFYYISKQTAIALLNSQGLKMDFTAAFFYILYTAILFIALYCLIKFVVIKSIYVFLDNEIDEKSYLQKYKQGQKNLNTIANFVIGGVLIFHILLKVFDIKIFVLGALCIIFVFRNMKVNYIKAGTQEKKEEIIMESRENSHVFEWYYNVDPFSIKQPARFIISIPIDANRYMDYKSKEHLGGSPTLLRGYVLDGVCPEIVEFARQVKKICTARGFTAFHQISSIMAFQQSLKYTVNMASEGHEDYVRYPLETIVDKEGDCNCHIICSAAILYAMGYNIVLLDIIFPSGEKQLSIAVEGAEGIPGNFFEYNNKTYYYCELTPLESSLMSFRVGEMPNILGANVTAIPIKEIIPSL